MSGRTPLILPHPRRRARQDARLVGAWLFRDGVTPPLEQPPVLRTLVGPDFMEAYLRGVGAARGGWDPSLWTPLAAWRDWSEPPRATRGPLGVPQLAPTLQRREPLAGEVDARDGESLQAALESERGSDGWIRKLYLPLHRHFTLITTELLCCAAGTPPIDPARVLEVGCVIRRLVLGLEQERWQDWVVGLDGGRWVELDGLDEQMRLGGVVLDPRALPASATYEGRTDLEMRAVIGVTDVTIPLSIGVASMSALPPTLGEAGRHTAHYALLPVMTRELQRPEPPPEDLVAAQEALVAQSWGRLKQILGADSGVALNERIGVLWRALVAAVVNAELQQGLNVVAKEIEALCPPPAGTQPLAWKNGVTRRATLSSEVQSDPTVEDVVVVLWRLGLARKDLRELYLPKVSWDDGAVLSGLPSELDLVMGSFERKPVALPSSSNTDGLGGALEFGTNRLQEFRLRDLHHAGQALEAACDDFMSAVEAAGAPATLGLEKHSHITAYLLAKDMFQGSPSDLDEAVRLLARFGVDLDGPLARVLLAYPRLPVDASRATSKKFEEENSALSSAYYIAAPKPGPPGSPPPESLRPPPPLPRFDPDHVYAARCFARVRGADPCEADQIVWSARTEPYQIADAMDLLGLPPMNLRLPDIPKMLNDIPRIARARATPMVAVTTPRGSGFSTGKEPDETRRSFGIAWVCSFGIPVFTICAWILFLIIFSILILIPGFAWMLLLKLCLPLPVPKRA